MVASQVFGMINNPYVLALLPMTELDWIRLLEKYRMSLLHMLRLDLSSKFPKVSIMIHPCPVTEWQSSLR